mmetsp:Transcript_8729/g.11469  ORF Transcript_8729/g.11469 Transcript_8729/m.11469 type:complete len:80 (+) Transcript_8729:70-309(+)
MVNNAPASYMEISLCETHLESLGEEAQLRPTIDTYKPTPTASLNDLTSLKDFPRAASASMEYVSTLASPPPAVVVRHLH